MILDCVSSLGGRGAPFPVGAGLRQPGVEHTNSWAKLAPRHFGQRHIAEPPFWPLAAEASSKASTPSILSR